MTGMSLCLGKNESKTEPVVAEQSATAVSTASELKSNDSKSVANAQKVSADSAKKATTDAEKSIPANAPFLFWSQLVLLLVIIYFGIKYGGIALGMLGGLGVTLLVFLYGVEPGKPPIEVMLIILASNYFIIIRGDRSFEFNCELC